MDESYSQAIQALNDGGIVVMPSDTIYGVFVAANNPDAVERLYEIRRRDAEKACIVLIPDIQALQEFKITLKAAQKKELKKLWYAKPTTVILPVQDESFQYVHRGLESIAFRIPSTHARRGEMLRKVLTKTGPLLAPSANLAGEKPAETVEQAQKYFGDHVDHYIDFGEQLTAEPSQIFDYTTGELRQIR